MDISKVYFQECNARYVPLGFRSTRRTYARILNDVMQTFTFKRYSSGCECTVEFGVFPLCQVIKYPEYGHYNLCNFEVLTYYADWSYDKNSEDSVNACVKDICGYIDRYLLPLFTEANCSEKALPALIGLDTYIQNVRQAKYRQKRMKDRAKFDWRYASLLHTEKFFMALKCGQYDYAREAAQVLIPTRRPEYAQLYQSIVEHLDAGDIEYVENILDKNEKESLKNLGEFRLTPIISPEPN